MEIYIGMKQCSLFFKISLITIISINALALLYFGVTLLLSVLKITVFGYVHFVLGIIVVSVDVVYLFSLIVVLIVSSKKIKL